MQKDYFQNKFHFSIDDTFNFLKDAHIQKINIKNHPIGKILYKYSIEHGLVTSLYCFKQQKLNDKNSLVYEFFNKNLFNEIKDWIKLGYHGKDSSSPPYKMEIINLIQELDEFYSHIKNKKYLISKFLRFHYYSEMHEVSSKLNEYDIKGLFTTDKNQIAYRLNDNCKKELINYGHTNFNQLKFISTHFRIENFYFQKLTRKQICKLIENKLNKFGFIIIYVHEYDLYNNQTLDYLNITLEILFKDFNLDSTVE